MMVAGWMDSLDGFGKGFTYAGQDNMIVAGIEQKSAVWLSEGVFRCNEPKEHNAYRNMG